MVILMFVGSGSAVDEKLKSWSNLVRADFAGVRPSIFLVTKEIDFWSKDDRNIIYYENICDGLPQSLFVFKQVNISAYLVLKQSIFVVLRIWGANWAVYYLNTKVGNVITLVIYLFQLYSIISPQTKS